MSIAAYSRSVGVAILIGGLFLTTGGCAILVPHVKPEPLPANDSLRVDYAASTSSELTKSAPKPDAETPALKLEEMRPAKVASNDRAMKSAGGVEPQLIGFSLCEEHIDPSLSNAKIADFSVGTVVLYGWAAALTSSARHRD